MKRTSPLTLVSDDDDQTHWSGLWTHSRALTCTHSVDLLESGINALDLLGFVGRTVNSRGLRDRNKENTLTMSGDNPI
jgi:hypothetical protein